MKASVDSIVGVHCSDVGVLWYAQNTDTPTKFSGTISEFIESELFQSAVVLRVPGAKSNVPLLLAAHAAINRGSGPRLEVGSPAVCDTAEDRKNPAMLLLQGRACQLAASVGGWHEFTRLDYPSYALAQHCKNDAVAATPYLRAHPARRVFDFVKVDPRIAAYLIAEILDPRWFVDRESPDRSARLERYLGLTLGTVVSVLETGETGNYSDALKSRCRLAICAGAGSQIPATEPAGFLARIRQQYGGVKGVLRATQVFVRLLRGVWLDGLSVGRPKGGRLFVPEYFFKTPEEAAAFRAVP